MRRGDKVVLRPGTEGDVFDKILDGRTATIERIYRGYDDRVYLGVTVDDDPARTCCARPVATCSSSATRWR